MKSKHIITLGVMLSILSGAITLFTSCDSHTYEEAAGPAVTNPVYTTNIKPVFQNNCVSCHSQAYGQEPYFETYDQVKEETLNGDVVCRIDDQSCGSVMPTTGRMAQPSINLIKTWKANGCPEQ